MAIEAESGGGKADPRVERTRQRALSTAFALLEREGWDALTHAHLAGACGISRMTLYRHWPTRLDLLRDTLQQAARVRHVRVTGDVRADLAEEMQLVRRQLLTPARGRLLASLAVQSQTDRDLAALRDAAVGEVCSGLVRVLEEGMASGSLPDGLDVRETVSCLVGPLMYRVLVEGRRLTASFVDRVTDQVLTGVIASGFTV